MSEFLNKKAFEISFAVFRVAALIKKLPLSLELEKLATEFVSLVGKSNLDEALNLSSALKNVIKLGEVTFEIKQINAGVLLREISSFESLARVESGKDLEIESLFSQPSLLKTSPAKTELNFTNNPANNPAESGNNPAIIEDNPAKNEFSSANSLAESGNPPAGGSGNADLILTKIRQLGNCRTRDLISFFSNLSERTLRGYLKLLCDQDLIERLGAGGPDTHYRSL